MFKSIWRSKCQTKCQHLFQEAGNMPALFQTVSILAGSHVLRQVVGTFIIVEMADQVLPLARGPGGSKALMIPDA